MKPKSQRSTTPPAGVQRMTVARLRWLDEQLTSMAVACPWDGSNPRECPLAGVRRLPAYAVAKWLAGLTAEEQEYLVLYHECCLGVKGEADAGWRRSGAR